VVSSGRAWTSGAEGGAPCRLEAAAGQGEEQQQQWIVRWMQQDSRQVQHQALLRQVFTEQLLLWPRG
jgi:hypothetical protein